MTEEVEYKPGDKVHYTRAWGKTDNGIVKRMGEGCAFVVYHCNQEWDRYFDYTAARTELIDLKPGWV